MAEVISLFGDKPQEPDDPQGAQLAGQAFCGACQHEWSAIAEVGATRLECPNCKRMWGAFKNVVEPETSWRCNCGEWLFWLTPKGAMCRRCGVFAAGWAD